MHFAVVFLSKQYDQALWAPTVEAIRYQIAHDVAPDWSRVPVDVKSYASLAEVPPDGMPALMADYMDVPDALAYHKKQGDVIWSLVSVPLAYQDGVHPCVDLSHEIAIEALLDPNCNSAFADGAGNMADGEMADPVQDQTYDLVDDSGKSLGLPPVSSYVLPAWTDPDAPTDGTRKFDRGGVLTAPFSRTSGGYMMVTNAQGQRVQLGARPARRAVTARSLRSKRGV